MSSYMLIQRSRTLSDHLPTRIFTRLMGGGPRTFPGGLNKWQWKRMHEKRAREKEKRLIDQEKQVYQARVRSQIRANLAGVPDPGSNPDSDTPSYGPMSPNDHVKALADRFMKEGAEDLWNEKDGPLKCAVDGSSGRSDRIRSNQRSRSINSPVDLRKLMIEGRDGFNYTQARDYSVQRSSHFASKGNFGKPGSSSNNNAMDNGSRSDFAKKRENGSNFIKKKSFSPPKFKSFRRNESSSSDEDADEDYGFESDDNRETRKKSVREIGSRAALGKYDVKTTKRVPLKELEKERDFEKELELIRRELGKQRLAKNEVERSDTVQEESVLTQKRFDECGLSPLTVKALTAAGYLQMTRVQEATLSLSLEGKDALVKAKTGTGKSAAFLLPAIETVLKSKGGTRHPRKNPIYVLILCPTRELASQLAAEANAMLKYHDGIGVLTLVGGTRFKDDQKRLESDPCQIVVATPGRLLDHIENKGGLSMNLMALKMLVLDEADHLLDLGFRKDVEKLVDCVPRQRQSLMFSATIPKEVRRISQLVLKREHDFVDTVGLGCVETPVKVKQSLLVVPHEWHFQIVHHLLKEHILQTPEYKVIVFCTTAMVTSLMYMLFREMKLNVREIHSRKPQLYRTRVSDEFKESKRLILITSDVTARGMNYPDVTLVIQVGVPDDRELYIHRLGRTGREGKDGEGVLLLAPWEEYFLDELEDLPLDKISSPFIDPETKLKILFPLSFEAAYQKCLLIERSLLIAILEEKSPNFYEILASASSKQLTIATNSRYEQVDDAMSKIDSSTKEAAYHAWLGYYNSIRQIGRDKTMLVELANKFSESIGLQKPPSLFRKTALKMGLKDIPGIRIRQ